MYGVSHTFSSVTRKKARLEWRIIKVDAPVFERIDHVASLPAPSPYPSSALLAYTRSEGNRQTLLFAESQTLNHYSRQRRCDGASAYRQPSSGIVVPLK